MKIYIVYYSWADYEDAYHENLVAFTSEEQAQERVKLLTEQMEKAVKLKKPISSPPVVGDGLPNYNEWRDNAMAAEEKWREQRAAIMTLDPSRVDVDDHLFNLCGYYIDELELI